MTTFIAVFALMVLSFLTVLGNFWFTYGIWPRSWGSFVFFAVSSILISQAMSSIVKAK